jgi:Xaa-Pro aminopeptidase
MTLTIGNEPRLERLLAGLEPLGVSEAVLFGADSAVHLCDYSRYLAGPSAVVITADRKRTLVVAQYEVNAAEETGSADEVMGYGPADFLDFDPAPKLAAVCGRVLMTTRIGVSGADAGVAAALNHVGIESVRADEVVTAVRRVKDLDELDRIAASRAHALVGQDAVHAGLEPGVSDLDLQTRALAAAQMAAAEPIEFVGGIAGGRHSADVAPPVYVPGTQRLEPGDCVLADVAVRARGYWGDTTRTSVIGANDEITETIKAITAIPSHAGAGLQSGRPVSDFYADLKQAIQSGFPDGWFPHHGGHCIGLGVGENPQIIPSESTLIETGMVFAVEPGVYFPGRYGVRVEDMFVVTSTGGVRLDLAVADIRQ